MTTNVETRLASYSSPVLSVFRVVFGLLYTLYGSIKLFGWPLGQSIPVGTWPAWWAGLIEFTIGLLILVGFFTRIAAFIASGEMAVAYFWMHWPPLQGPSASFWPYDKQLGGNGGQPAVMFCFAFLLLATMGAGAWSIDARRRGAVAGAPRQRYGRVGGAPRQEYAADERAPRQRFLDRFRR
jgi:putative oxidoreductase